MTEHPTGGAAAEIKRLADDVAKKLDDMKGHGTELKGRLDAGDKVTAGLIDKVDEAICGLNESRAELKAAEARVAELEQRAARPAPQRGEAKSFGRRFVDDDDVKAFAGSVKSGKSVSVEFKATITSSTADAAGSAGAGVEATRLPGIVAPGDRQMTIRDLLAPGRMDGSTLEYVQEVGFTNAAAPTAEGAAKPQSDLQFELVETSAKVIAHWMLASRQILDDFSALQSYIDYRLRYGLAIKEEQQILMGDGTGQNLHGLVPQATAYAPPAGLATDNPLDTLRLAILQTELAEFPATGVVLHPTEWAWIEMAKTGAGEYLFGGPGGQTAARLWRLPVVATTAMTVDKFLVGSFGMGAQVFDRWQSRVEISTEDSDNFRKNLVTILAEERLALAVYRPESFVFGDMGRVG